jgi:hypothetical protein
VWSVHITVHEKDIAETKNCIKGGGGQGGRGEGREIIVVHTQKRHVLLK